MRTSVLVAVTGGTATTMLLAIAATGGLGALTDAEDEARPLAADEAKRPEPAPVVVKVELPVKPVVLPSGAPACGNVMTKFVAPRPLTPCATEKVVFAPAARRMTIEKGPGRYAAAQRARAGKGGETR